MSIPPVNVKKLIITCVLIWAAIAAVIILILIGACSLIPENNNERIPQKENSGGEEACRVY